ncbi:MAG: hypothetical protein IPM60_03485 [Rhodospirillales bacterium]|nr:hypothetical protein [Rhodospirillales bacterium]
MLYSGFGHQSDAGFETTTEATLFGDEMFAEALYAERAQVLDRALKAIRRDKATFRTLTERGATIESAGNILSPETNLARLTDDEKIQAIITALAHRRGPISDALNAAARAVHAGEPVDSVVGGFLESVRRGIQEGLDLGADAGGVGRGGEGRPAAAADGEAGAAAEAVAPEEPALFPADPEAAAPAEAPPPPRPAEWSDDLAEIAVHHAEAGGKGRRGAPIKRHPDWKAAKAGDADAAFRLVRDMVRDDVIEAIRVRLAGRRPIIVAPIKAEARGGGAGNIIPDAYAQVLGRRLGLDVDTDMVQVVSGRTGLGRDQRLVARTQFNGRVEPGRDYLLVDDHVTMGGTLADLRGHIEAHGGRVILATTLSASRDSARLAPSPAMLARLRGKFPELPAWWRERFGYELEGLTDAEARGLAAYPSFDAIRNRLAAAAEAGGAPPLRGAGGRRGGRGGTPGGGGPAEEVASTAGRSAADGVELPPPRNQQDVAVDRNDVVGSIVRFVRAALSGRGNDMHLWMGRVSDANAARVADLGIDIAGHQRVIDQDLLRHAFKEHGRPGTEAPRGQRAITSEDVARIPEIVDAPDTVTRTQTRQGLPAIQYTKRLGDEVFYVEEIRGGKKVLGFRTMWVRRRRGGGGTDTPDAGTPREGSPVGQRPERVPAQPATPENVGPPQPPAKPRTGQAADAIVDRLAPAEAPPPRPATPDDARAAQAASPEDAEMAAVIAEADAMLRAGGDWDVPAPGRVEEGGGTAYASAADLLRAADDEVETADLFAMCIKP